MPRPNGKPKKGSTLGHAIMRSRWAKKPQTVEEEDFAMVHAPEEDKLTKLNKMKSVTEYSNDLEEFMENAMLADKDFTAVKQNVIIIQSTGFQKSDEAKDNVIKKREEYNYANTLKVPRRPAWDKRTTPDQLDANEKASFLEWRRNLAKLEEQEGVLLTPFEKNLEVWRQLWRVVERSHVVVQIVDARNPLLFRCPDLEEYVKEVDTNKLNLLVVNKADLLTDKQREVWASYFTKAGLKHFFFSANAEQQKLDQLLKEQRLAKMAAEHAESSDDSDEDDDDEDEEASEEDDAPKKRISKNPTGKIDPNYRPTANGGHNDDDDEDEEDEDDDEEEGSEDDDEPYVEVEPDPLKVYTKEELISFFESLRKRFKIKKGDRLVVGMVGYPNVGKSSTVNSLMGQKKVAVASTPGKTKHFQSLLLGEHLCLMDCPGLVFPTFMMSKPEMVVNAVLPIDKMTDYTGPIQLICDRIPRTVLEEMYGIVLPKPTSEKDDPNRPPTYAEFLQAYGFIRGYMTVHGQPDEARAARYVLKDYVNGKLLYCYPPPGLDFPKEDYQRVKLDEDKQQHLTQTMDEILAAKREHKKHKKLSTNAERKPTYQPKDQTFYEKQEQVGAFALQKGQTAAFNRAKFQFSQRPGYGQRAVPNRPPPPKKGTVPAPKLAMLKPVATPATPAAPAATDSAPAASSTTTTST